MMMMIMKTHLKTHTKEKSSTCNQYDSIFSWAGDLRGHLKAHSEEKQSNITSVTTAFPSVAFFYDYFMTPPPTQIFPKI